MKINKSPGPDRLHPRIFKELSHELAGPLSELFRLSMMRGEVPEEWRNADITAIFKKGDRCYPENYRPISLTCIVIKILETAIREDVMKHMKKNGLFSKKQFGFISARSTVLQLIKVLDKWTEAIDERCSVDVTYCDFKKAFDKVPHNRLLHKIRMYGIGESIVNWFEAFLKKRKQRVIVEGEESGWYDVISGIPQGSVMGPVLFVLYINDLPDVIKNDSDIYLYADDTKIFRKIVNVEDIRKLQEDIYEMRKWSDIWLLEFHPDKCHHMTIGRHGNVGCREGRYKMFCEKDYMDKTDCEKDLGVVIDTKLSFENHLAEKINKASKIVGLIRRTFENLDQDMFKTLYVSLVRPHLEFANQIWCPHLRKHIEKIENVQRRATKLVPGLYHLSYSERLRVIKLPTLAYRRVRGDMIECYKILTGKYDDDVTKDVFKLREQSRTRGHKFKIFKERSSLNLRKYSFTQRVVDIWNLLPERVVNAPSTLAFERLLDEHWVMQDLVYDHTAKLQS